MNAEYQRLYLFLAACQGNWRNSVYITNAPGYLLSADRAGQPVVMSVEQFQQFTDESIDPTECCSQLTAEGFKSLYAQYLLWRMPSAEDDPLPLLSRASLDEP